MEGKIEACARNRYFNIFNISFCIACFFIALLTGILITQSGTGISPDSTNYIQAGENIYSGNGFYIDYPPILSPLTSWPPLYPILIAAFMHMHLTAEDAARMIPILSFALSMFPIFFLGRLIGGNFTAYIACLISLVFTPLLMVTSFAWTEMMYIFLSLMAILALTIFSNTNKIFMLYASGIFTGLAFLTRYIGITLFVASLIILILNRDRIKNRPYNILIFSSVSLIPISIWIFRNILLTRTPFGGRTPSSPYGILYNIDLTIRTILKDFFTVILPKQDSVYIIAIIIIFCAMIFLSYKNTFFEYFKKNYILIIYILIYLIILIVMASVTEFDDISYRLTSPAYPFMLLTLISFIHINFSQLKKPSIKRGVLLTLMMFFTIMFMIQLNHSVDFYQSARMGQGYNSLYWRNTMEARDFDLYRMSDNLLSNNTTIYTNDVHAIEFWLKRPGRELPNKNNDKAKNNFFKKLTSNIDNNTYIIYLNTSMKSTISYEEIIKMNKTYNALTVVYNSPSATIFKPKLPD